MAYSLSSTSTTQSLDEQLRNELRICPQCRFEIKNPLVERCPRCLASIPVNDTGCSRCIHNLGCPMTTMNEFLKR